MKVDFKGRVAIVTGAGVGLGRAHALGLASHGAKLFIADIDEEEGRALPHTFPVGGFHGGRHGGMSVGFRAKS